VEKKRRGSLFMMGNNKKKMAKVAGSDRTNHVFHDGKKSVRLPSQSGGSVRLS
jgi:hypothetical protein